MDQVVNLNYVRCHRSCLLARHSTHVVSNCQALSCRVRRHATNMQPKHSATAFYPPQLRYSNSRSPALHAVKQHDAQTSVSVPAGPSRDAHFGVDQAQLQKLAQSKGTKMFDGATFANVFQLATALKTSLDSGLIADAEDLEARAAIFGANTLPAKQEVKLISYQAVWHTQIPFYLYASAVYRFPFFFAKIYSGCF